MDHEGWTGILRLSLSLALFLHSPFTFKSWKDAIENLPKLWVVSVKFGTSLSCEAHALAKTGTPNLYPLHRNSPHAPSGIQHYLHQSQDRFPLAFPEVEPFRDPKAGTDGVLVNKFVGRKDMPDVFLPPSLEIHLPAVFRAR